VKKHVLALGRLEQDLKAQGDLPESLLNALSELKSAASALPEKKVTDDVLTPPSELQNHPQGLAIYSDGACRGNPGPGAWGCVAQNAQGDILFEASGFESNTTNNRMEILGAINGIQLLEQHLMENPLAPASPMMIFTDSKYVVEGINQWVAGWKARGWKKADGKTPENLDLWQLLDETRAKVPQLKVAWVKGHNGHPQNEFCDRLANRVLDAESN
jgi:ribonuclease HI